MNDSRILNIADAVSVATIIGWAQRNAHLRWLAAGDVLEGTARSIGDERGNHASGSDDVRDCFLRITTSMGFEWFLPMSDAIEWQRRGEICED